MIINLMLTSMESQRQIPEFSNNPGTFTPVFFHLYANPCSEMHVLIPQLIQIESIVLVSKSF